MRLASRLHAAKASRRRSLARCAMTLLIAAALLCAASMVPANEEAYADDAAEAGGSIDVVAKGSAIRLTLSDGSDATLEDGGSSTFRCPKGSHLRISGDSGPDGFANVSVETEDGIQVEMPTMFGPGAFFRDITMCETNVVVTSCVNEWPKWGISAMNAGSEERPEVGDVFRGSCKPTWIGPIQSGGYQEFRFSISSGILSELGSVLCHCADYTAADPYIGQGYTYKYTVTSVDKESGIVTGTFYATANSGSTDGTIQADGTLDGYQRAIATVTIKRTYGGYIQLTKSSASPSISSGNPLYSIAGATYGVFTDEACTNRAATLTTDASGNAGPTPYLDPATYWVKEVAAPKGYAIDTKAQSAHVVGGTFTLEFKDEPLGDRTFASISKHDAECGWKAANSPLGAATLEGAQYAVEFYTGIFADAQKAQASGNPAKRWVFKTDKDGIARLADTSKSLLEGTPYRDSSGRVVFPLGTYVIYEILPPVGYLPSQEKRCVTLQQKGNAAAIDGDAALQRQDRLVLEPEQVKRSDICLTKVRESDMARLAHVPFRLTSETTGESHILVTDENGRIDTSAAWNPHTQSANSNDRLANGADIADSTHLDAYSGVWFGLEADGSMVPADDGLGALPYDTYRLEELRCASNEGLSLVVITGIVAKRDKVTIDLGTVDDRSDQGPYIHTSAYDATDLDKSVCADLCSRIVDHVEYMNLTAGSEYELKAWLVDADTGQQIPDADGLASFTPHGANGSTEVPISADLLECGARRVVVFEELLLEGVCIAEHKDASDLEQTVVLTQPEIVTRALDAHDGDKEVVAEGGASVIDQVQLSNLTPEKEYRLFGIVIDPSSGLPALSGSSCAAASGEDGGHEGRVPSKEKVESFWNGALELFGIEEAGSDGSFSYAATEGFDLDWDAIRAFAAENEATMSSLMIADESFQADSSSATTSVEYTIDASRLEGGYVIYDMLTSGNMVVSLHADSGNEMQSFEVVQPSIGTTAADATDGDHAMLPSMEARIVDTVEYKGLLSGSEYTLVGMLVEKSSGEILSVEDKNVESRETFIPNSSSGTTSIEFSFDASGLPEGTALVAFEYLLKDGENVAEHADIADEAQTVFVGSGPKGAGYPKTGHEERTSPLAAMALGTAVAMAFLIAARRPLRHA